MALTTEDRLTLFEHLDELRKRLFVCLIAATVGVLIAALFNSFMFEILLYPLRQVANLPETATKITTFSPAEPFMVSLKVWVVGGLILAAPVIIYELWAFLAPAFTAGEKKYFYPVVFSTTALFFMGVALAYFLVLPKGLSFLLTFSAGFFNVQLRASDYFTFMALFILAFGVVFELPVVLVLLAKVGVIDDKFLQEEPPLGDAHHGVRRRRHHAQPGRLQHARHVRAALRPLRGLDRARPVRAAEEGGRTRR